MPFTHDWQQICTSVILAETSAAWAESARADAIIMEARIFFIFGIGLITKATLHRSDRTSNGFRTNRRAQKFLMRELGSQEQPTEFLVSWLPHKILIQRLPVALDADGQHHRHEHRNRAEE